MTFNYKYKITFDKNRKFDLNYIISAAKSKPNDEILIEVPDTTYLNTDDLKKLPNNIVGVRIASAYDNKLLNSYKDVVFKGSKTGSTNDCKSTFYDSVIYTKNESIKILEEIENIEKDINPNWSDIQKIIYIYDSLKSKIFYDPKFEAKGSDDIRSLRGLISKKTVCAGYALIFKEILERNNIKCHFVCGSSVHRDGSLGGHAWNVIELDGKLYPIDLTWEGSKYRTGNFKEHSFLANDVTTFNQQHKANFRSDLYGMEDKFEAFNPNLISYLSKQMARSNDFTSTTFTGVRLDGSKYFISQIGDADIDGHKYYRYHYVDIHDDGTKGAPLILYSDFNIARFVNNIKFNMNESNKDKFKKADMVINNILFSKKNIQDSLNKKTYYIGGLFENPDSNKGDFVSRVSDIKKPSDKCNLFTYPTRRYRRSDGSAIIVQCISDKPNKAKGVNFNAYSVIELIDNGKGKPTLKKNTIFSESDLINDTRKELVDVFLSRDRLDNITNQTGGYVGTFNKFGAIEYNQDLAEYFDISKYVGIDGKKQKKVTPFPTFEELHDLVHKYEIVYDAAYLADPEGTLPKVCDKATGNMITDISTINKVYLANSWLVAAGTKFNKNEKILGETYAFNEDTKKIYNLICSGMRKTAKDRGVIDTVAIFRRIEDLTGYKYSQEIVCKLFKTPMQVELFNKMAFDALGMESQGTKPTPLYTYEYAGQLAFGNQSTM